MTRAAQESQQLRSSTRLGACGVYLGDVRPVDIALAGAYLAGAGLALAAAEPPAPAGT